MSLFIYRVPLIYNIFISFTRLVMFSADNIPTVSRKKSQPIVFPLLNELDCRTKTLITDRHLLPVFRTPAPHSNVNLDFKVPVICPRQIIQTIFMPARKRFLIKKKRGICNFLFFFATTSHPVIRVKHVKSCQAAKQSFKRRDGTGSRLLYHAMNNVCRTEDF